jgi:BASS family bile acid:Na+ symporter
MVPVQRLTAALTRRSRLILALSLGVGLALQPLAATLKPALPYGVIGLLWAAMVRLDIKDARNHIQHPRRLMLALISIMVVMPLVLWGLGQGLEQGSALLPVGLASALLVMAVAPPVTSAPAMALLLGLDGALALLLLLGGTVMVPLIAPLLLGQFSTLALGPLWSWDGLAGKLALSVVGTTAAALLARRLLTLGAPQGRQGAFVALDLFSLGCLVVFAIAIMDGMVAVLWQHPGTVALMLGLAYGIALSSLVIAAVIGKACGLSRQTAATIGYCLSNRNMALMMATLPPATAAAGGDADSALLGTVWLWFAVVQFPIYTLPMILSHPLNHWMGAQAKRKRKSHQGTAQGGKDQHQRQ